MSLAGSDRPGALCGPGRCDATHHGIQFAVLVAQRAPHVARFALQPEHRLVGQQLCRVEAPARGQRRAVEAARGGQLGGVRECLSRMRRRHCDSPIVVKRSSDRAAFAKRCHLIGRLAEQLGQNLVGVFAEPGRWSQRAVAKDRICDQVHRSRGWVIDGDPHPPVPNLRVVEHRGHRVHRADRDIGGLQRGDPMGGRVLRRRSTSRVPGRDRGWRCAPTPWRSEGRRRVRAARARLPAPTTARVCWRRRRCRHPHTGRPVTEFRRSRRCPGVEPADPRRGSSARSATAPRLHSRAARDR